MLKEVVWMIVVVERVSDELCMMCVIIKVERFICDINELKKRYDWCL